MLGHIYIKFRARFTPVESKLKRIYFDIKHKTWGKKEHLKEIAEFDEVIAQIKAKRDRNVQD